MLAARPRCDAQCFFTPLHAFGQAGSGDILLADVEPVNRKPECRVVTTAKPQVVTKPFARGFGVVGEVIGVLGI